MLMASRMGTPAEMSVPSVRVNRAMAVLPRMLPRMGTLSLIASVAYLPPSLVRISFQTSEMTIGDATTYAQPQLANQRDTSSRICVMGGSLVPKSLKIVSNFGITNTMIIETMPTAMLMTTAG